MILSSAQSQTSVSGSVPRFTRLREGEEMMILGEECLALSCERVCLDGESGGV